MVRAILKNGSIQPLDPLPHQWREGQELFIQESIPSEDATELTEWSRAMDEAASKISDLDRSEFEMNLDQIEKESKDAVRKEWGLT